MTKVNIYSILLSFLVTINQSFAELTCSRTGTTVLYINGINTSRGANEDTAAKIDSAIERVKNEIDKKSVSRVKGVYNYSAGISEDIEETKAQVAINHLGEKRERYWRRMALAEITSFSGTRLREKVNEAFDQLHKMKPKIDPITKEIDQDYFTELDFYKSLRIYEPKIARIFASAYSDNSTVEELKNKILESYDDGKGKVIVVAHSQGNEVLYSAVTRINAQAVPSYLIPDTLTRWSEVNNQWFNSVIGYVQLAPPSPRLVSPPADADYSSTLPKLNHSRYIRLNLDKIINNSYLANRAAAGPVNVEYDLIDTLIGLSESNMRIMEILEKMNVFNTAGYHSVDNVYLSNDFVATNENGKSQTMLKHFQNAIAEVAGELNSNCKVTIPAPTVGLCQVWSRYGTVDQPIEYFAYEDHYRGMGLSAPSGYAFKAIDTYCNSYLSSNGVSLPPFAWCLGRNNSNRVLFQSIGGDIALDLTYTSPCYEGRVFPQSGVVPL